MIIQYDSGIYTRENVLRLFTHTVYPLFSLTICAYTPLHMTTQLHAGILTPDSSSVAMLDTYQLFLVWMQEETWT